MDTRDTRGSAREARPLGRELREDRMTDRDVRDVRTPAERAAARDDRSITDLLKELRDETTTLLRQEVALAKTEMSEKAAKAARNAAYAGAGTLMIYLGVLFGLAALTVGLAIVLGQWRLGWQAWWLAPLIVGVSIGVIGCAVTAKGVRTLKRQSLVPEKTVGSLQEDKQWLQERFPQPRSDDRAIVISADVAAVGAAAVPEGRGQP